MAFKVALPLRKCLYGGHDRYGYPFVAFAQRDRDDRKLFAVQGRELRLTWGGWAVWRITRTDICIGRLWAEYV